MADVKDKVADVAVDSALRHALGWLVFGHVPDAISLIGMGLVVVAGVSIALRSHFDGRKAQALAAR